MAAPSTPYNPRILIGSSGEFLDITNAGAGYAFEQGHHAGERNADSKTSSYLVIRPESNLSVISKTTAVTIGGGVANDVHLIGITIHTALVGTMVITGFEDSDGTAQSITYPIGTIGDIDFRGAKNAAGALTITASSSSDDNVINVYWREA